MNQRLYIRDRKIHAAAPGKKLATLIEESDMLNAKSSDSLFRDWQWVSPVNCFASRFVLNLESGSVDVHDVLGRH